VISEASDGKRIGTHHYRTTGFNVLDLMMPGDGRIFSLGSVKGKSRHSGHPVIVSTAKELTEEEKGRLKVRYNP
jgi:hypothetical protein